MPVTSGFNHVATLTPALDRLVAFYREVFDAGVRAEIEASEGHPRMAVIDLGGGAALNAFEAAESDIIGERRRQGGRGAIDHYAIAVGDRATLDQVRDRL